MGDILIWITAIFFIISLFVNSNPDASFDKRPHVMKQEFDRGYAVECLGKQGYYWECDE